MNKYLDKEGAIYSFTKKELEVIRGGGELDTSDNYKFGFFYKDKWLQREITPKKEKMLLQICELQKKIWHIK